jgi:hypothetical protein
MIDAGATAMTGSLFERASLSIQHERPTLRTRFAVVIFLFALRFRQSRKRWGRTKGFQEQEQEQEQEQGSGVRLNSAHHWTP